MLYFLPRGHEASGHFIFMGRDKVENEDLIKYGLPEDVWCAARVTASLRRAAAHRRAPAAARRFHVDKLSSAHVYMRVQRGETMADLSKEARARRDTPGRPPCCPAAQLRC